MQRPAENAKWAVDRDERRVIGDRTGT